MPEVRGQAKRDTALRFQRRQRLRERRIHEIVKRLFGRGRRLLRRRLRLPLKALIYFGAAVRASHFALEVASPSAAEAIRPLSIIPWIISGVALLWIAS